MDLTLVALGTGIALAVGLALQPLVVQVMLAKSIIDTPNGRSSHSVPTPRGGGIAVAAAAGCALLVAPPSRIIDVPLMAFAAIGLAEDIRGIPIAGRLAFQAVAGLGAALVVVPTPFAPIAIAGVVLWLVGYVNVFNFMDGVNGISALNAILAGLVYAAIGWTQDRPTLGYAGLGVAAAAATFLPWNAGRARIFLGDVGSYGLGGLLGALAAYGVLRGVPVEAALGPLALYLADTGWTLLRRWRNHEVWYEAHRTHVYQQLTAFGWSHSRVALLTVAIAVVLCACALAAFTGSWALRAGLDALAVLLLAGYLALPWRLRRRTAALTSTTV